MWGARVCPTRMAYPRETYSCTTRTAGTGNVYATYANAHSHVISTNTLITFKVVFSRVDILG